MSSVRITRLDFAPPSTRDLTQGGVPVSEKENTGRLVFDLEDLVYDNPVDMRSLATEIKQAEAVFKHLVEPVVEDKRRLKEIANSTTPSNHAVEKAATKARLDRSRQEVERRIKEADSEVKKAEGDFVREAYRALAKILVARKAKEFLSTAQIHPKLAD